MKKSTDFYKVVNAVINTISEHGGVVHYVGKSGYGTFTWNDSNEDVRNKLSEMAYCDELEWDDDLYNGWTECEVFDSFFDDSRNPIFDFYCLWNIDKNGKRIYIQLAINPDNYVKSSYELRDMIADDLDLERAEITEGMNGYPSHLRGCVLINDGKHTFDELEKIANRYGVEVVELHQKAGWQLWECRGTAFGLFDAADYISNRNDNFKYADTWKAFAEDIREYVDANARYNEIDQETADKLNELADLADQREPMDENECVSWEFNDYDRYEVMDRMTDHFDYDSSYYTLAFDCMIEDY